MRNTRLERSSFKKEKLASIVFFFPRHDDRGKAPMMKASDHEADVRINMTLVMIFGS